jgi:hypothetical protein
LERLARVMAGPLVAAELERDYAGVAEQMELLGRVGAPLVAGPLPKGPDAATLRTLADVELLCLHIGDVQRNCRILGERLIASGEGDLGLRLIANGMFHDASKFHGIEWEFLRYQTSEAVEPASLKMAIAHHNKTNAHHPEFWTGGAKSMPPVAVAEMICDWKARSGELGSSLLDWINGEAPRRFGYSKRDRVHKDIIRFATMLLDKPFIRLPAA